jgi:hypothetical protein
MLVFAGGQPVQALRREDLIAHDTNHALRGGLTL